MDNENALIFWSILVIAGFLLDALAYFVLRDQWQRHGMILTDVLRQRAAYSLGQTVKTWREKLSAIPKPKLVTALPQPNPSSPSQVVPASVKMVGQLRQVEFSIDMPLNSAVDVHIGATSEAGVKVEKREL